MRISQWTPSARRLPVAGLTPVCVTWPGLAKCCATTVDDIRGGGDKAAFAKAGYALLPGWSYRNMWWVTHNPHGAFMARGVHGQRIYVDPKAQMVIVRYASHPVASNSANDPVTIPAFEALGRLLASQPR